MSKILRSLYTFYLNHFFVGLAISLCCYKIYAIYGPKTIFALFWFKAATIGVVFYAVSQRKQKEFYYYQNLGISKKLLWTSTLGIDFLLFVSLLTLAHQTR